MIKLAALEAGGQTEQRTAGPQDRRTAGPQDRRISKDGIATLCLFNL
jgi:hypothetical protein